MHAFMGIDPGQAGGIAVICGKRVELFAMPSTERALLYLLKDLKKRYDPWGMRESVHSLPGNAAQSMFTFGRGVGQLEMGIEAAKLHCDTVTPQKWMKQFGLKRDAKAKETKPEYKKRLLAKAQAFYPQASPTLKTADALLIARYCSLIYK